MTGIKHNLEEVMLRSHQWQDHMKEKFEPYIPRPKPEHYELLHDINEKIKDCIAKVVYLIHKRVLVHPYVEKCHSYARELLLHVYKRTLPYLAKLSENSLLAGGLGFVIGVSLTAWLLSTYYAKAYQNIIKRRLMSGVTFDLRHDGLESLSLKSDLLVPRITNPQQILIRVHAASVDQVDIAILSGDF